MNFRNLSLCLGWAFLSISHAHAASNLVSPEQIGELNKKNAQIKVAVRELDDIGKELIVARAKHNATADTIERLELESDQAAVRLETLQKIDRESPDTIAPEKLSAAKDKNRQAILALNAAMTERDAYAAEAGRLKGRAIEKYAEFRMLERSFERDVDTVVNAQTDQRISSMHTAKEVVVTTRTSCGDESIKQCKERA